MVHPDDFQWSLLKRYPWFCHRCSVIRAKEKHKDGVIIRCSTCKEGRLRVHKDDVQRFTDAGWICPECFKLGVCTEK